MELGAFGVFRTRAMPMFTFTRIMVFLDSLALLVKQLMNVIDELRNTYIVCAFGSLKTIS